MEDDILTKGLAVLAGREERRRGETRDLRRGIGRDEKGGKMKKSYIVGAVRLHTVRRRVVPGKRGVGIWDARAGGRAVGRALGGGGATEGAGEGPFDRHQ